jgi:cold shock CspA family protein/ribosome-associated translation inhibitor RaiA
MQLTPTITFRGIGPSAALEAAIRARIDKLETYYHSIMGCRVLVEFAQRHHETGNRYHVRIDLTVPGEEIVVAHDASLHATAQDVAMEKATKENEPDPERKHAYVAIREAFDVARRRLQDFARRQRGTVKAAARRPRGRVVRLFPIDEYGYIEADDGHEVYFQRSSVLKDAFNRLTVGSTVSFVEEPGEKGPQASTVMPLHPRRRRPHAPAEGAIH